MKQNEHVNVARAVLAAVEGLCRKGLTMAEAGKVVRLWIDSAEGRGAENTERLYNASDHYQRQLIKALIPSHWCPHSWEKGACIRCGVLRMHVDPEGYAAEAEQNARDRKALGAPETALPRPPRIPIKRSS